MIKRHILKELIDSVDQNPAVALLGPRQVGKTTLALEVGKTRPSTYLDLESDSDRAKLSDPDSLCKKKASNEIVKRGFLPRKNKGTFYCALIERLAGNLKN